MKKILYFACAGFMALGTVSCNEDDNKQAPELPKSLSASPDAITFSSTSQIPMTIEVKAENVVWEAATDAAWLSLSPARGDSDGTISVTASDNETTELRQTDIIIRGGEGVEAVKVAVTQAPGKPVISEPTIIWERTSRSRMNFRGDVKEASTFGLYLNNAWESIDDLKFDTDGMLTSFTRTVNGQTLVYALAYDAANRLTKCSWSDADGAKSVELTYGNHGRYIYTENLFNDISMSVGVANFTLWLPRYIKNLEKVVCKAPYYRDPTVYDTTTYRIEVTGDTGKIFTQLNDEPEEETSQLGFTGDFTTRYVSTGWFGSTTDFTVNPENGNLLQYTSDDGYSTIVVTYDDNRINTLSKVQGDISTEMTYNQYLDVVSATDPKDGSSVTMSYEYDVRENWSKMTLTGPDAGQIDRTLTYYE